MLGDDGDLVEAAVTAGLEGGEPVGIVGVHERWGDEGCLRVGSVE